MVPLPVPMGVSVSVYGPLSVIFWYESMARFAVLIILLLLGVAIITLYLFGNIVFRKKRKKTRIRLEADEGETQDFMTPPDEIMEPEFPFIPALDNVFKEDFGGGK